MTIQLTYQLLIGQLIMRFFLKTLAYLKEKQYLCRAKATISALEEKKPTHRKHNPRHDYKERCIYHITLVVSDRCKVLGRIIDARDKGLDLKKVPQPNGEVHCRYRWERDQDTEAKRAHQNESVMKARQGMPCLAIHQSA